MAACAPAPQQTPYDFIEEWKGDAYFEGGVPSAETLKEVARALHAVQEFLVEPIARDLKKVVADVTEGGIRRIPKEERLVDYELIGRLLIWTDELRAECGHLLDPIVEVALLAHEDLVQIAEGYVPDGVLSQASWSARLRRFHGLNELRW